MPHCRKNAPARVYTRQFQAKATNKFPTEQAHDVINRQCAHYGTKIISTSLGSDQPGQRNGAPQPHCFCRLLPHSQSCSSPAPCWLHLGRSVCFEWPSADQDLSQCDVAAGQSLSRREATLSFFSPTLGLSCVSETAEDTLGGRERLLSARAWLILL